MPAEPVEPMVTLEIPHDPSAAHASGQEVPGGWVVEEYRIAAARGPGAPAAERVSVPPETVVEIVLEDGSQILVTAEDAARYLGEPDRGTGDGVIRVGAGLRLGGASRDGFGAWLIQSIRVFRKGPAAMSAVSLAGTFQDRILEQRLGLYRCSTDRFELQPVEAIEPSDQPALVFIHGTASSTRGSFEALWTSETWRREVLVPYGRRVFALEHRTLTESPVANALELVGRLPEKTELHLVTHSRGGLVGELLSRAGRRHGEPFTRDDLEYYREHAAQRGSDPQAVDVESRRLVELNGRLGRLRVTRFVRVACPARGTTLASGRLDRWATAMLNVVGLGLKLAPATSPFAGAYGLFKSFLLKIVEERTDAKVLPGLEAMMPESSLVALLNRPDVEVEGALHVIAGDFEGGSIVKRLGDWLSERFYGGCNDLVVNTPSMTGGARRTGGTWWALFRGPEVHHLSYFRRAESARCMATGLAGRQEGFETARPPGEEIARGFLIGKPRDDQPIALVLPGIMGSHLTLGRDRIWFDPLDMIAGRMARLTVDSAGVEAEELHASGYRALCRHLEATHEVRTCPYDWRLSLEKAASEFGRTLDAALAAGAKRRKPVRIVAHSMGGLVARLALAEAGHRRWDALGALEGSRLLQLGTPNGGSHSIAGVLLGRDAFVQLITRWFDWRHSMAEFLAIVSRFPGVLELLPAPETGGADLFEVQTWDGLRSGDREGAGRWVLPEPARLKAAAAMRKRLDAAALRPELTVYIAGKAQRTPAGVSSNGDTVEVEFSPEGDGRVLWRTGIPRDVPTWYMDAEHGNLCAHRPAFAAVTEVLSLGRTNLLPTRPPATREAVTREVAPSSPLLLYPSAEEVENAIFGITPPRAEAVAARRIEVRVVHGNLAGSDAPVLIGHYAYDGVVGSAAYLDGLLGGRMDESLQLGIYPSQIGESRVYRQPHPGAKPGGALVVGLGQVGELTPGGLLRTLTRGLLSYVTEEDSRSDLEPDKEGTVEVGALLVGTGFGGVEIADSVTALLRAAQATNQALERTGASRGRFLARLTLFEESLDRAVAALRAVERAMEDRRLQGVIDSDRRLHAGEGGYRRVLGDEATRWWRRILIRRRGGRGEGLQFVLFTDRARSEEYAEAHQLELIDRLVATATANTTDNLGLSRALFELLIPNRLKDAAPEERGLVLVVDPVAAAFPWELMRAATDRSAAPLATEVGMVRQLSSARFRSEVVATREHRALVVGEPDTDFAPLPGARAEAEVVVRRLAGDGYAVEPLIGSGPLDILSKLFDQRYRVLHFAGHGVVNHPLPGPVAASTRDDGPGEGGEDDGHRGAGAVGRVTGMVMGVDAYLTAAQVSKLRHVPELVFINCCHLGDMRADAESLYRDRAGLAAGLATAFIEMGARAVVAAGWAVRDQAARTFAEVFYDRMLRGVRFGDAVREARQAAFQEHPGCNTWGAYQAYGDPEFRLEAGASPSAPRWSLVSEHEVVAEADRIRARAAVARVSGERESLIGQLQWLDREMPGAWRNAAIVAAAMARAYADLGDLERAIEAYRRALAQEEALVHLKDLEQLGNLEVRLGAKLAEAEAPRKKARGRQLLKAGLATLERVAAFGPTTERLSLLGSARKREATLIRNEDTTGTKGTKDPSEKRLLQSLEAMVSWYGEATDHARATAGEDDYYPLLNRLDGLFVLAARGVTKGFREESARLGERLEAARRNAERRWREERKSWHATVRGNAALTAALYATVTPAARDQGGLDDPKVVDGILRAYEDEFTRMGTEREWDSVISHVAWLLAMLPDRSPSGTPVKVASVRAGLERLLARLQGKGRD